MSSDPPVPAGDGETSGERPGGADGDRADTPPAAGGAVEQPAPVRVEANGFSIAAMVCGGLAVLFVPIVLGPIGLILGAIARSRNEPRANMALAIAGGGMVLGFLLGALLLGLDDSSR